MTLKDFIKNNLDLNTLNMLTILLEDGCVKLMNNNDLKRYLYHKAIDLSLLSITNEENKNIKISLPKLNILINIYDTSVYFVFNDKKIIINQTYKANKIAYMSYQSEKIPDINKISIYFDANQNISDTHISYKKSNHINVEKIFDNQLLELVIDNIDSTDLKDLINIKLDMDLTIKNEKNLILKSFIEDLIEINLILNKKESKKIQNK